MKKIIKNIFLLILISFSASATFAGADSQKRGNIDDDGVEKILREDEKEGIIIDSAAVSPSSSNLGGVLDSLVQDTAQNVILLDSLVQDSTLQDTISSDSFVVDTLAVVGGVLPYVKEKYLDKHIFADTVKEKEVEVRRPFSKLALERSPIFEKDTISYGNTLLISLVAPGFGQLYNNDYWKIPILYSSVGGLTAGALIASPKYKQSKLLYDEAAQNGASSSIINSRYHTMSKYKTRRNAMISAAAISYIYFLCDAAVNYKGEVHPARKATMLSAVFPGAGQLYNGKYWKLPIVYGGFSAFAYVINYNNRGYQRYKQAYDYRTDGNDKTVDPYVGVASDDHLKNIRDSFRRYRDLGIIMTAGFYILQIIDAHVDAYLERYDVSDDLSLRVEPIFEPAPNLSKGSTGADNVVGVGMKLKF